MIRSALRSLSYLVEDMVSVVKWAVGELVSELDYRLQPEHVRQGWAAELADIEAGIDVHEPNAPYLQWGGPETWPQSPYCNRCGYPHPTDRKCLRDVAERLGGGPAYVRSAPPTPLSLDGYDFIECTSPDCTSEWGWGADRSKLKEWAADHNAAHRQSSAVPPTAERPSEVSAAPPSQTPSEGHPLFTTSLLLEQGAVYAEVLAAMEKDEEVAKWHRIDAAAMRERADAFKAIENTT